jgi:hypothetical protein
MNRRHAMLSGTARAVLPLPVEAIEDPHVRMHRLIKELAETMPHCLHGGFRAVVGPDGSRWLPSVDLPSSQMVFNLSLALRRVLILSDKRTSAARYAKKVLAEADKALGR